MPCFVNAAPGHIAKVLLVYPGGYTHILWRERNAEGMFTFVLPAFFKVKMQLFYQVHAPVPLLLHREGLLEEAVINLRRSGYLLEQFLQGRKKGSKGLIYQCDGTALFIFIQESIVGVRLVS